MMRREEKLMQYNADCSRLRFFYRWFAFCHDSCFSAFLFCFNYFQPRSSPAAFLQRLRMDQGAAAIFHLHEALQETPERHGETWRLETGITTRSVKSSLSSCRLNLLLLPSSFSFFIMFFSMFSHRKEYTHTHTPMLNAALLSKYYTPNSNLFVLTVNLSGDTQRVWTSHRVRPKITLLDLKLGLKLLWKNLFLIFNIFEAMQIWSQIIIIFRVVSSHHCNISISFLSLFCCLPVFMLFVPCVLRPRFSWRSLITPLGGAPW